VVQNWTVSVQQAVPARFPRSVIPVWILVAIGAVLVGVFAPRSATVGWATVDWMPIVLFGGVMATFVIQLALDEKTGLVNRVMASLGGSVVILAAATAVFAVLR
jgi:uncharacterized membrane protein YidH (DUF202 family)